MNQPSDILVVDLDHSLIEVDLLQQSSKMLLLKNPLYAPLLPIWLMKGKGHLKHQLAKRVAMNVETLPYHQNVLAYIKARKAKGHHIVLATASYYTYAEQINNYLNLFDEVLASDVYFNLSSHNKAMRLVALYGQDNFDYIGDHKRDLPVWQVSRLAIGVNLSTQLKDKITQLQRSVIEL